MDKLKNIGVKIDPATLQRIDEMARVHKYWKRNTLINAILGQVFSTMTKEDIFNMCRDYWRNCYV